MNVLCEVLKLEFKVIKEKCSELEKAIDKSIEDRNFESDINCGLTHDFLEDYSVISKFRELTGEYSKLNSLIKMGYESHYSNLKDMEIDMVLSKLLDGSAKLNQDNTITLKNWCPYSKFDSVDFKFDVETSSSSS